jgi:GTPase SAR1 family protein/tricorn protease-like protein/uncharacterized CHY-type Zn-finger protein
VLVLCLSAAALAADWPQLESHTFRLKDRLNRDRRFIPLRLDDAPLKGSPATFSYIDWRPDQREQEYPKLLEACRQIEEPRAAEADAVTEESAAEAIRLEFDFKGIYHYAFGLDGKCALVTYRNNDIRLWDMATRGFVREFVGHSSLVHSVVWSDDQRLAVSGSYDQTSRIWDVETGRSLSVLEGHTGTVEGVACSPDGQFVISGSWDATLRLWDLESNRCVRVLEGHTSHVRSVSWNIGERFVVSGSDDKTVRVWDIETGRCVRVFVGHTGWVLSTAWSPNERFVLSDATDDTARLWDIESGRCLRVMEDQSSNIEDLSWSVDGQRGFIGAVHGGISVWDLSEPNANAKVSNELPPVSEWAPDQIQYTNAKVLLVGNSAAGKTGLSNRLALGTYKETDSTVGAWATQWKIPLPDDDANVGPVPTGRDDDQTADRPVGTGPTVEREVWLWDFGGQADQRLIHQLYMDQTQVASLVFDPQKPGEQLLDALGTWDRDLTRAATQDLKKLLVAGRTDAGGLRSVSRGQVETFAKERGFAGYLETSAKENVGCEELKAAIVDLIDWDQMTKRTSPALFKRLKEEIVRLKEEGRTLMRFNELREALVLRMSGRMGPLSRQDDDGGDESGQWSQPTERFSDDELKTVISLLAGPGVVWELGFGSWILLQPELINSHAQAVIRSLRDDERELGCIAETQVLSGDLAFPKENPRLESGDERIVLLAMHQILIEHGLCLRDEDPEQKSPTMLVFPSYARRERPDLVEYPSVIVSYQFNGFLDDIYATLVVRLHHTQPLDRDQLWLDAADFKTMTGRRLGVKLSRRADGAGELEVYFDPDISVEEMMIFSKYVHEHLLKKAKDVVRLRHYVCSNNYKGKPCETEANREVAMRRLAEKGKQATIICVQCEKRVKLWDDLEKRFAAPEVQQTVRELEEQSKQTLDSESKERILVGEVISTVALAGQLCEEFTVTDHGIDMEIIVQERCRRGNWEEALFSTEGGRLVPDDTEERRSADLQEVHSTPCRIPDGSGVPGDPPDSQLKGRDSLDGNSRPPQRGHGQRQEAGPSD